MENEAMLWQAWWRPALSHRGFGRILLNQTTRMTEVMNPEYTIIHSYSLYQRPRGTLKQIATLTNQTAFLYRTRMVTSQFLSGNLARTGLKQWEVTVIQAAKYLQIYRYTDPYAKPINLQILSLGQTRSTIKCRINRLHSANDIFLTYCIEHGHFDCNIGYVTHNTQKGQVPVMIYD